MISCAQDEFFSHVGPKNTQQLVLAGYLRGRTTSDVFRIEEAPVPYLAAGCVLIRNQYLSVDPAMRTWAAAQPGRGSSLPLGTVMRAHAIGTVMASRNPIFAEGSFVSGVFGARIWHVSDGSDVRRIWPIAPTPKTAALGVLGHVGLTAMVGLTLIAPPRAGETVLVSSAAGAVGAVAGQIAHLMGARVVGIAGGPEKTALCRNEYGFDAALDHRACDDLSGAIALAAPEGIDVFFDNVGGRFLDAALPCMNSRGRIAICGTIGIDSAKPGLGPRLERTILERELSVRGFLQSRYESESELLLPALKSWFDAGDLRLREDITAGLESVPAALEGLLTGSNFGKVLIDITKEKK
jgi:hypothetical protein